MELTVLHGEAPDVDRILGAGAVPVMLLLSYAAAPRVRAALERRGAQATVVTAFQAAWPDDLPGFFAAYEASDRILMANRNYWDWTGRLPGTTIVPWGADGPVFDAEHLEPSRSTNPSDGRLDVSDEVTVFVTSIGASSYAACRRLLQCQDCVFRLEFIEGVNPLSAALQQMIDRCRTPYYLQVDEDMLLYPHAVRALYEAMSAAPSDVAMVVGHLYDMHLQRCIHGVKLARHDIASRYPWREEPMVIRRLERLEADGYRVLELPVNDKTVPNSAVGLHGTHASPAMLHDRYLMFERLRRTFPSWFQWFEACPPVFLKRFLAEGAESDLQALLGVLAGALAGPLPPGAEIRSGLRPAERDALARHLESVDRTRGASR